jgi:hypothetical protein
MDKLLRCRNPFLSRAGFNVKASVSEDKPFFLSQSLFK